MKFTLNLTHRCNLSCRYCYGGNACQSDMQENIARQSVDFAFRITPDQEPLEFSFFGGEPLLCPGLVTGLTAMIQAKREERSGAIRLSMTTNGTLINHEIADFLGENRIDLCISIDGPEHVHNTNRIFSGGQGSHHAAMRGLSLARAKLAKVQVNAVYSPDTFTLLPETLEFFLKEQIGVIHFNPDICATWQPEDLAGLSRVYEEVADMYLAAYRKGQEVALNLLDSKMVLFIKGGYHQDDRCGMGETEMAVAPSGNLYPCERFVGNDDRLDFVIGHVGFGFYRERRCNVIARRATTNSACRDCAISSYCMNWCGCTNFKLTGHTDRTGPMMCISERAIIAAAHRVFNTLIHENNELFYSHLFHYAQKECHQRIGSEEPVGI